MHFWPSRNESKFIGNASVNDDSRYQNYHVTLVDSSWLITPIDDLSLKIMGKVVRSCAHAQEWWESEWITILSSSLVTFPPLLENELLEMPIERFFASLRFEQRGKPDKLGVEMGFFDWKSENCNSPHRACAEIAGWRSAKLISQSSRKSSFEWTYTLN